MAVIAKLNNLRISPRKVRLVADMVRGKNANNAQSVLSFCIKKGSLPIKKLLDSAIANAKNNFQIEEKDLFIYSITVDEGRTLKRWRARARGRSCRIEKKTSNITLGLDIFKGELAKVKAKGKEKSEVKVNRLEKKVFDKAEPKAKVKKIKIK